MSDYQSIVLFLEAAPMSSPEARTSIDRERAGISAALARSRNRDCYRIVSPGAIRRSDLLHLLRVHKPRVLHIAGHTERGGIVFDDGHGSAELVTSDGLAAVIRAAEQTVEVVVLGGGFSIKHAASIAGDVDTVIGMSGHMPEEAAVAFSVEFYSALFDGASVYSALEAGRAQIAVFNLPGGDVPVLVTESGPAIGEEPIDGSDPLLFIDGLCYMADWHGEIQSLREIVKSMDAAGVSAAAVRTFQIIINSDDADALGPALHSDRPPDGGHPLIYNAGGDIDASHALSSAKAEYLDRLYFAIAGLDLEQDPTDIRAHLDRTVRHLRDLDLLERTVALGEIFVHKWGASERLPGTLNKRVEATKQICEWAEEAGPLVYLHLDASNPNAWDRWVHDRGVHDIASHAPGATLVWAHGGVITADATKPSPPLLVVVDRWRTALDVCPNVLIDLSWSAKRLWLLARSTAEGIAPLIDLISEYADRFVIGTDFVPKVRRPDDYAALINEFYPLLDGLDDATRRRIAGANLRDRFGSAAERLVAYAKRI